MPIQRTAVQTISSSLLIFLYSYTAVSKLQSISRFRSVLRESPLIHMGADIIAWLLPATELLIVLLLVFISTRETGLYSSFILLLMLTVYLGYMIHYTPHLPCSCGGVISKLSWREHVVFNVVFIVINIAGIYSYRKK